MLRGKLFLFNNMKYKNINYKTDSEEALYKLKRWLQSKEGKATIKEVLNSESKIEQYLKDCGVEDPHIVFNI